MIESIAIKLGFIPRTADAVKAATEEERGTPTRPTSARVPHPQPYYRIASESDNIAQTFI